MLPPDAEADVNKAMVVHHCEFTSVCQPVILRFLRMFCGILGSTWKQETTSIAKKS